MKQRDAVSGSTYYQAIINAWLADWTNIETCHGLIIDQIVQVSIFYSTNHRTVGLTGDVHNLHTDGVFVENQPIVDRNILSCICKRNSSGWVTVILTQCGQGDTPLVGNTQPGTAGWCADPGSGSYL